jgi:penicillin-binding protein 1A
MAIVVIGLTILAGVAWIFGIMMAVAQDLPSLESRAQYDAARNSVVVDSEGERVATLTNNEGRILVESGEIAPTMKEAVVAIEDRRFYDHRGVDVLGIMRALREDVLSGSAAQGASTITQQFVKNALEAQDSRTIFQKLREAALAYQLERNWNKDKIMTEYLNSIYFGEGAYGIEAAAKTYFGGQPEHRGCGEEGDTTCASELLPWEAALLAGIISSPTAYSPRTNPEAALERRNLVLQNMQDQGYITDTEYLEYSEQPIPKPGEISLLDEDSEAPYFTSWLRQQLVDYYGAGQAFAGGLEVQSTLDLELQRQVEEIAASRLAGIEPTASVVVLENENAGVKAMVGGNDFAKEPFNLATNGRRQPGSSFKPFTLVTALEQGRSPEEVFTSAPQEIPYRVREPRKNGSFKEPVPDLFEVSNYEDSYLGSASLATATTASDNSVYAQLGTQVGPANVAATAEKMGIGTDISTASQYSVDGGPFEPYNPGIILGGLEVGVTPLEMAHAYVTLSNEGRRTTGTLAASDDGPVAIENVREDDGDGDFGDGEVVETTDGVDGTNRVRYEQAVSAETASTATSILETVVSSGTGTNAATGEPTWGKTGTTDDNGDAWFVGSTDEITVAVWVGHADGVVPMETEFAGAPVDGGTFPALIFHDVVLAWEELQAARGEDADEEELVPEEAVAPEAPVVPEAPVEPVAPAPEAPVEEAPVEPAPPPETEEVAPAPEADGGTG